MAHAAKILLDSICPREHRLTSVEVTFPRIILAEWNTHRKFTRSSASSRAIPVAKMIKMVLENPYIPSTWGKNQKGMSAAEDILGEDALACERNWLVARDGAVRSTEALMEIGVHKQTANRLLEPFMWHVIINSATDWSNFFGLRNDKNAHPDIQIAARLTREAMGGSDPTLRQIGEWHAPYTDDPEEIILPELAPMVSAGRCARVSYLTHDGKRDPNEDIRLHDGLLGNGHMAPLEHPARVMDEEEYNYIFSQPKAIYDQQQGKFFQSWRDNRPEYTHYAGNFEGWVQYRKHIPHEDDYGTYLKSVAA